MSGEANTVIVRRMFEEIFNQGKLALVETWVATTFLNHAAPVHILRGLESLKEHVILLRIAFPDLHFTVEELIADEERVAVRVTFRDTHRGVFRGFPPNEQDICPGTDAYSSLRKGEGRRTLDREERTEFDAADWHSSFVRVG